VIRHRHRDKAAALLHALADTLARNNAVEFNRTIVASPCPCPTGQPQEIDVEIGDIDHELEEELSWRVRYAPWHPTGFIRGPMGI
jgi:hypothetical protein